MDTREKELQACLTLKGMPGLGPRTIKNLLSQHGTFVKALENVPARKRLFKSAPGRSNLALLTDRQQQLCLDIIRKKHDFILLTDPHYPHLLRELPDPPPVLYYQGDISLLQKPALAIVGSRKATSYGLHQAKLFSRSLARAGLVIVSGLALGIDTQAHWAGLQEHGKSIAVLGTGLDICYPRRNKQLFQAMIQQGGLVLSEFEPGVKPLPRNFPIRNRIISGLSLGVLVAEAAAKSGSLITAHLALEQDREVFALPGPVDKSGHAGSNKLIQQGALLVSTPQDIIETLIPILPKTALTPHQTKDLKGKAESRQKYPSQICTPREEELLILLHKRGKMHIDSITQAMNCSSSQVSQWLTVLEVKGVVKQHPGLYYSLLMAL